jgi:predicted dehydrogenase
LADRFESRWRRPADGSGHLLGEYHALAPGRRSGASERTGLEPRCVPLPSSGRRKFRLEYPSGIIQQGTSTYSSALSSILFIQGSNGRLLLTPAYNFDEARHLTGMIGRRPFARTFKVVDECAPEIDPFAAAIIEKRSVDPDGAQGLHDMLILRAIYEWARKQQPLTIQYRNEYAMAAGTAMEKQASQLLP